MLRSAGTLLHTLPTLSFIWSWDSASPADRDGITREAAELSADLTHWLRELQAQVLERQERVLRAVGRR